MPPRKRRVVKETLAEPPMPVFLPSTNNLHVLVAVIACSLSAVAAYIATTAPAPSMAESYSYGYNGSSWGGSTYTPPSPSYGYNTSGYGYNAPALVTDACEATSVKTSLPCSTAYRAGKVTCRTGRTLPLQKDTCMSKKNLDALAKTLCKDDCKPGEKNCTVRKVTYGTICPQRFSVGTYTCTKSGSATVIKGSTNQCLSRAEHEQQAKIACRSLSCPLERQVTQNNTTAPQVQNAVPPTSITPCGPATGSTGTYTICIDTVFQHSISNLKVKLTSTNLSEEKVSLLISGVEEFDWNYGGTVWLQEGQSITVTAPASGEPTRLITVKLVWFDLNNATLNITWKNK